MLIGFIPRVHWVQVMMSPACTATVATFRVPVDPCTSTGDSYYFSLHSGTATLHSRNSSVIAVQFQGIPKWFHWNPLWPH